ncbi:uncharacterized protein Z520_07988 [Fonsecaea multimorphosa CBS 102226]|uniref:AB hydrolase-1 domain-containing protein n=1 Tax=Fonsecaea multimorphosa CBS 102226 TaxID=1442371 RepID=A0A0D2H2X9_9EURO|nr:uncharacterized protein Z520_07988 [Fonsecaea multimorphosa CBS 102226]KIX96210.1 hypothetical protein Z520_07988 [Fonsecaea multimorphosa CBS 102226]OAL22213.1 hypothetical protein AYO22_07257 [Fonsecaea multimorphosa]
MAKPTLLFVPGAWHSPSHYEALMKVLEKHGYQCEAVSLPSVDPKDPPNTDCNTDVSAISDAIRNVLASGNNVVLITHSYSGIPGHSAAYSFIGQNEDGPRLTSIAMMCSFLYPPQTALMAPTGGQPHPIHVVSADGNLVDVGGPGPEILFYNDVPAVEAARCAAMIKSHSWRSKTLPPSAEGAGWWEIPTSYLICEKDNAIPADLQRKMVADANEALSQRGSTLKIREETVDSGHSPFLSVTEQTADFIRRSAGEQVPFKGRM